MLAPAGGTAADITTLGYPNGITQHIHVQVKVNGNWVDPTPYFFPNNNTPNH